MYGTDDAAAVTAAVTAAAQWAVATGNYKAQVVFEPQLYMLGALTQSTAAQWAPYNTGLNYTYNTHVPLPFTGQYDRRMVSTCSARVTRRPRTTGGQSSPACRAPAWSPRCFPVPSRTARTGSMSVIGGPSAQTNIGTGGIGGAQFADLLVNVDGITVVTPFNSQAYGFDFRWVTQANMLNGAAIAFAPVNFGAQAVGGPWLRVTNRPSNTVAVGLAMPALGNNDNCNIGLFSAEGLHMGMTASEHFTAARVAAIYCNVGIGCQLRGGIPRRGDPVFLLRGLRVRGAVPDRLRPGATP